MNPKQKKCTGCKKVKPIDSFYYSNFYKRYLAKCKSCELALRYAYYRKNKKHIVKREKIYNTTETRKLLRNENDKRMYRKFRDKWLARAKLRYAVRVGKVKKLPCEVCGKSKSHGHHPDYSKPLDVIWLCVKHHWELHTK